MDATPFNSSGSTPPGRRAGGASADRPRGGDSEGSEPLAGLEGLLGPSEGVRVILVGRTGIDQKLRQDVGLELIRVRTPMDAIGELSDPIDAMSPRESVVVLGTDAQPGMGARKDEQMSEFVSGLRAIDPHVRVLAVSPMGANSAEVSGDEGPLRAALDGLVHAEWSCEDLIGLIRWHGLAHGGHAHGAAVETKLRPGAGANMPTRGGSDHAEPRFMETPGRPGPGAGNTSPTSAERVEAGAGNGTGGAGAAGGGNGLGLGMELEGELVAALVRGQDVLARALQGLRWKLRDSSLAFEGLPAPAETDDPTRIGVPVVWESRMLGVLSSQRTPREQLAGPAAWLAGWIVLRDQHVQLRRAAFTDPLTGAWNRRYFDTFLSTAIAHARATRHFVTVLMFDIDNFKHYNDAFGHEAGDEILVHTVKLLRSVIRPSDRVCRIGGDEFAVIFHEPDGPRDRSSRHPHSIFEIAKRFQQQVTQARFPKLGELAPGTLTISGGLATFPWDGATAEELLRRADELAMQSKRAGKNAVTLGPGAIGGGEMER